MGHILNHVYDSQAEEERSFLCSERCICASEKYHESLLPSCIWGEQVLEELSHTSTLHFRQIIYVFVLLSCNLHRLSPGRQQSSLLNGVCHSSHHTAPTQRDLWQR